MILYRQYFAYLESKINSRKLLPLLTYWQYFVRSNFFELNERFFPEIRIIIGSEEGKKKVFRQSWS